MVSNSCQNRLLVVSRLQNIMLYRQVTSRIFCWSMFWINYLILLWNVTPVTHWIFFRSSLNLCEKKGWTLNMSAFLFAWVKIIMKYKRCSIKLPLWHHKFPIMQCAAVNWVLFQKNFWAQHANEILFLPMKRGKSSQFYETLVFYDRYVHLQ